MNDISSSLVQFSSIVLYEKQQCINNKLKLNFDSLFSKANKERQH